MTLGATGDQDPHHRRIRCGQPRGGDILVRQEPQPVVVVAGRTPRTQPSPGTTAIRLDASSRDDVAGALNGVDAVVMCAERNNAQVARTCLERGVDYIDVSASPEVHAEIEKLDDLARRNDATVVLSVGLAPGITNLLARHCVERSPTREVHIGVLLGSGEQHGWAALAWTLDGLGRLDGSWIMDFPAQYGTRTVHRFPFSDQYTLPDTLGISAASTGLCLDSGLMTALLAAAGRPAVARLLRRPKVRNSLLTALARIWAMTSSP